jgi:hypothetical protein
MSNTSPASIAAAATSLSTQARGRDACPVCATAGTSRGARCASCGVRLVCPSCSRRFTFDEARAEQPCGTCGHPHEVPRDRLVDLAQPSWQPLQEFFDDWLRSHDYGRPVPTLRRATFDLARAEGLAGNWQRAAELLDAVAREPGDDPPSMEVQWWRGRAFVAGEDMVAAARMLLTFPIAPAWDESTVKLARALLAAGTSADAARLAPWLQANIAGAAADPSTGQAQVRVVAAALCLLAGDAGSTVQLLADATAMDPAAARHIWSELATTPPIAAALDPGTGNEAASLTLSALIAAALGNAAEASTLVDRVLDNGLTGDAYPETDAYLLRGHDASRSPRQRAKDLLEAARRLGWRGAKPDLLRSMEAAAEAAGLEPTLQEIYWVWADSQRCAAYQADGNVDQAAMLAALSIYDSGLKLGPAEEAWQRKVEGLICQELSFFNSPTAWATAYRCLRAVSEGALADLASLSSWALVAEAAYLLDLRLTARFAADLSLQIARDSSAEQLSDALREVIRICFQVAPDRVPDLVDELERESGSASFVTRLRAAVDMRAGQADRAKQAFSSLLAEAPTDANLRYWYIRSLVMSEDKSAPAALEDAIRQTKDGDTIDAQLVCAWALLWQNKPAEATAAMHRLCRGGVERQLDPSDKVSVPMQAALLLGRPDEAEQLAETLLPALRLGPLLDLDVELRWVGKQLDQRGDLGGSTCAARIRAAAAQARSAAPDQELPNIAGVLDELDRAICDATVPAEYRRALSTARLLIFAHATPVPEVADWQTPLAVELGEHLVPGETATWEQWELFTDIIPRMKARLAEQTGLHPPGVRVRTSDDLGPLEFRVLLDGHRVADGTAGRPDAESQPTPDGQVDPALWQQVIDSVFRTLSARPSMTCSPEQVWSIITEWEAGMDEEQRSLAAQLRADRSACIRLWQGLYATTLANGRAPSWDSGLRQMAENALQLTVGPGTAQPSGGSVR